MSLAFDFGDIKWGDAVEQCVTADASGRLDIDAESRLLAENSRDGINLLLKNVRYGHLGGARYLPETRPGAPRIDIGTAIPRAPPFARP